MTTLVKIGNSKGIRIPKSIIEQAHLENHELVLKVLKEGLLIQPITKPRNGWKEKFDQVLTDPNIEQVDQEWLDAPIENEEDWEW